MKDTILSRSAKELLERQSEIASGNVGLGCIYLIGRRVYILRKYVKICRDKNLLPELGIFSMLGEYELLKIRLIEYIAGSGQCAGDDFDAN